MALAPFSVALRECVETLLPHALHMPEGMDKFNPFLRPIASHRAVKALADAGEGLFQKSDQVVCRGCPLLGSKLKLTVQCFQIITNGIHRGIVSQISPVVKSVSGDLHSIGLVGFHTA